MGQIVIELYWDHAPETCRNFAELCRRGYYNNTKFHRIIRNFMIQGELLKKFCNLLCSKHYSVLCSKAFYYMLSKYKLKYR